MRRFIKWALVVVVLLGGAGFVAFLYFIPPFGSMAPETFIKAVEAPPVHDISDPAQRLLAERGRYLVMAIDCSGCHSTPGPQGPDPAKYLGGGMRFVTTTHGAAVTRNLTPDRDTGLGSTSDEDVARVLRSGVHKSGRQFSARAMPWSDYSNWTEEDRRAVIAYFRNLPPLRHQIPDPVVGQRPPAGVVEQAFGSKDYGVAPPK